MPAAGFDHALAGGGVDPRLALSSKPGADDMDDARLGRQLASMVETMGVVESPPPRQQGAGRGIGGQLDAIGLHACQRSGVQA
jgi:hypothetical protein